MVSPFSGGCKTGGRFPLLYHEAPRTARGKAEGRRSGDRLDRRLGKKPPPRAFFAAGAVFFLIENRGVPLIRHGLTAATPSPKRGEGFGATPGRSAPLSGQAKGLPLLAVGAAAPGGPMPKAGIRTRALFLTPTFYDRSNKHKDDKRKEKGAALRQLPSG